MKRQPRIPQRGCVDAQKPLRRKYELIDRSTPGRKLLEFPEMKGRVVEKIEFFSTAEFHSVNLFFADKTSLILGIEAGFELHADLGSDREGEPQITKRWPPIRSER